MQKRALYKVAEQSVTASRLAGEGRRVQKGAAIEALLQFQPDLDESVMEELAEDALLGRKPPNDQLEAARNIVARTTFLSILLLFLAVPFAVMSLLFGVTEGPSKPLLFTSTLLSVTLPISLIVWPFTAWWFCKLERLTGAKIVCTFPFVHIAILAASLAFW